MAIQPLASRVDRPKNRLLSAMPPAESAHWLPHLKPVELHCGQLLGESDAEYLYFPTTAIISVLYVTKDGASSEIAVIGHDGVAGLGMLISGKTQPIQAKVQSAGHAYRMRGALVSQVVFGDAMLDTLNRYAQAMHAQLAQTAVCNRHHSIDQQLCRRLLIGLDLSHSDELVMSHQIAGSLLGVRRESVTLAAHRLQDAGVIRYRRGHIKVLDRTRLEQRACECYTALRRQYDRLLPECLATPTARPSSSARAPGLRTIVTRRVMPNSSRFLCGT